jgi:hypothetical protein
LIIANEVITAVFKSREGHDSEIFLGQGWYLVGLYSFSEIVNAALDQPSLLSLDTPNTAHLCPAKGPREVDVEVRKVRLSVGFSNPSFMQKSYAEFEVNKLCN